MSRAAKLGAVVLAGALLVGGLLRLRFDVEVLNLLPSDSGVVQGLLWHQRHFQTSDELIVTLRADEPGHAAAAAEALATALRSHPQLTDRVLWQAPWQENPAEMAEIVAAAWLNQPPQHLTELATRLSPENRTATLESALDTLSSSLSPEQIGRLAYDPYGLTQLPDSASAPLGFDLAADPFASADGTFRLLHVRPAANHEGYSQIAEWLQQLQEVIRSQFLASDLGRGIDIAYTGRPAFVSEVALDMEQDIRSSVLGTGIVVCLLFWFAHRHWRPLAWLLRMLALIMTGTLALGGWLFGALNVVSLGFAAILIGLSVDYALVLYQEARDNPHRPLTDTKRTVAPGILWSALTTAGAFLTLNFGALPGLCQLGSLVAGGILLAAAIVLTATVPFNPQPAPAGNGAPSESPARDPSGQPRPGTGRLPLRRPWWPTLAAILFVGIVMVFRFPRLDHSADTLVSETSPAYEALQELNRALNRGDDPLPVLISGAGQTEVGQRLQQAETLLRQAKDQGRILDFSLPTALWPAPDHQQANRERVLDWLSQRAALRQEALDAGFTEAAVGLLDAVMDTWASAIRSSEGYWPTGAAADWLLEQCAARHSNPTLAMGLVRAASPNDVAQVRALVDLSRELEAHGLILTGWPLLGEAVLREVEHRLPWLLAATVIVILLCLYAAFGRVAEVALSLATLGLAFLGLMAVMGLAGWSWNLMNLTAIPLLFGVGVDYTIHVQRTLRRHGGDAARMRQTVGRALLLCAATTIAGFGSLTWANNPGLASLGQVCATGIGCLALVALGLLPDWWQQWSRNRPVSPGHRNSPHPAARPFAPSVVYHGAMWRTGLVVARILPPPVAENLGATAAGLYALLHPRRRRVVAENLTPVLDGNASQAQACALRLFRQFGRKMAALLRHESGAPMPYTPADWSGWEHLEQARGRGQGVLLVTLHLGDWEFGGALLARLGIPLLVLTQAEPGSGFTELRQAARRREGISTVVVGSDPFAFIEVVRRLQEGALVALLIDRPQPAGAVEVTLFNRPFRASIAAADLARATGCCLLPVYVIRTRHGCAAHVLPEIPYQRADLGNREARRLLTAGLLQAFEPAIRQHPDQWYHFIPLWPDALHPPVTAQSAVPPQTTKAAR